MKTTIFILLSLLLHTVELSRMALYSNGNHIHFNSDVSEESMIQLTKEIEKVNLRIAKMKSEFHLNSQVPILLFINSQGGCFNSALAMCNFIKQNINPIITVISGESASAGTMISCVGFRRLIYNTSYAMVHEGTSTIGGNQEDLDIDMHNMEITEYIAERLYIKNSILTLKEYNSLCIDDKVWDANMSYRYGLVDKIIDDPEKLGDWHWLLNIPSRKRDAITDIKTERENSEKNLSCRKRKRFT